MSEASNSQPTRKQRRELARRRRREAEAAARRDSTRRRRAWIAGCTAVAVLAGAATALAVAGAGQGHRGNSAGTVAALPLAAAGSLGALKPPAPPGAMGPERVPVPRAPVLAGTAAAAAGAPVDGIECSIHEQTLFHIHAHLAIYVDGAARQVPYGIGIPGARAEGTPAGPFVTSGECFYWLHTHASDGIVHIESPVQRQYTLGNFFDVWGEPLSWRRVGPSRGAVTALYNGRVYEGDPRSVPLTAHAQIQLDVGRPPVAPASIEFPEGL
jgi:hypothetical protein